MLQREDGIHFGHLRIRGTGTAAAHGTLTMKTPSLIAFGAMILIGWTALAGGVIAAFAGDPSASRHSHTHEEKIEPVRDEGPLLSDAPCEVVESVPCPA